MLRRKDWLMIQQQIAKDVRQRRCGRARGSSANGERRVRGATDHHPVVDQRLHTSKVERYKPAVTLKKKGRYTCRR